MTDTRVKQGPNSRHSEEDAAAVPKQEGRGALVSAQGRTTIADEVVAKVAGMATREVSGVHRMGGGAARAIGMVRERIPGVGKGVAQGVTVEVGERQAAVDIDLVVEYGVSIPDLAAGVRRSVIASVERMCGLEVTEVNITVDDIHLPDDEAEDDTPTEPRVQ